MSGRKRKRRLLPVAGSNATVRVVKDGVVNRAALTEIQILSAASKSEADSRESIESVIASVTLALQRLAHAEAERNERLNVTAQKKLDGLPKDGVAYTAEFLAQLTKASAMREAARETDSAVLARIANVHLAKLTEAIAAGDISRACYSAFILGEAVAEHDELRRHSIAAASNRIGSVNTDGKALREFIAEYYTKNQRWPEYREAPADRRSPDAHKSQFRRELNAQKAKAEKAP